MADPNEDEVVLDENKPKGQVKFPPVWSSNHPLQKDLNAARNANIARMYFVPDSETGQPTLLTARTIDNLEVVNVERSWVETALAIAEMREGPARPGPFCFHIRVSSREHGKLPQPARERNEFEF